MRVKVRRKNEPASLWKRRRRRRWNVTREIQLHRRRNLPKLSTMSHQLLLDQTNIRPLRNRINILITNLYLKLRVYSHLSNHVYSDRERKDYRRGRKRRNDSGGRKRSLFSMLLLFILYTYIEIMSSSNVT
ncbi:unnamed protein product [Lepeophtheirus salmonis]|uniref:(salmon louse) hypothetical protein n=1 Tax=Lepeophtheirus salmonis TaxID=72036 RepID=A0A7R8HC44_LEPSM|nr:unnamed protein product [Lepeophtheirus salmonis]CAF2994994.1 unnamed protein product [Lepeophtheirus salmonis]